MTTRSSASRRPKRRDQKRPISVVLAGLITMAVIVGFVYLAEESYNGLPFVSYRTVYAQVPNVGHLQVHDPVDIAGVRVGQVLRETTRDNQALVELQLQGVGPLPADSSVKVRANGLLGSRYVELDPGTSSTPLPDGATIAAGTGSYYNGVPETLNLFDAPTRTALGHMINGLGAGMQGRGSQLNQAIHVAPPSGANFDTAASAILARRGAAANLLPATDAGMSALSSARDNLANGFHPAAIAVQPLIDDRAATQQAIALVPGWEQAVDTGLGAPASQLLVAAQALGRAADNVLPAAPQALRSATDLLDRTPGQLRRTKTALDQIPTAVPATLSILKALEPDLSPLKQGFQNLVNPVTQLSIHGCDIQGFASAVGGVVNSGKAPGGNFGPNVGFPLTVLAGPQELNNVVNTGFTFAVKEPYPGTCEYTPGPTVPPLNVLPEVKLP
jgi:phospholipid/cholesterol/gamma-HCH transport system substrate-binding protein